jgi:hypothetical protein
MHIGQRTQERSDQRIEFADTVYQEATPSRLSPMRRQTIAGLNPPPPAARSVPASLGTKTMLGILNRMPLPPSSRQLAQTETTAGDDFPLSQPSISTYPPRKTAMSSQKPPSLPVRRVPENERIRVGHSRTRSDTIAREIIGTAHQPHPEIPSTTPPPSRIALEAYDEEPEKEKEPIRPPSIQEVNCDDQVATQLHRIPDPPQAIPVRPPVPLSEVMRSVPPPPVSTRAPARSIAGLSSFPPMPDFGSLPALDNRQQRIVRDAEKTFSGFNPQEIIRQASQIAMGDDVTVMRHTREMLREVLAKTNADAQDIREGLNLALGRVEGRLMGIHKTRQQTPRQSTSGLLAVEPHSSRPPPDSISVTPSVPSPVNTPAKKTLDAPAQLLIADLLTFVSHVLLGTLVVVFLGKEKGYFFGMILALSLSIYTIWKQKTNRSSMSAPREITYTAIVMVFFLGTLVFFYR